MEGAREDCDLAVRVHQEGVCVPGQLLGLPVGLLPVSPYQLHTGP